MARRGGSPSWRPRPVGALGQGERAASTTSSPPVRASLTAPSPSQEAP